MAAWDLSGHGSGKYRRMMGHFRTSCWSKQNAHESAVGKYPGFSASGRMSSIADWHFGQLPVPALGDSRRPWRLARTWDMMVHRHVEGSVCIHARISFGSRTWEM